MTNERETRAMSRFLTSGGKMLQEACDDCGSPLFRHDGEVVCAVCNERTDRARQDTDEEDVEDDDSKSRKDANGGIRQDVDCRDQTVDELRNLAARLASEASEENDLSRLDERLELLERTVELIERMEGEG